jgi:hypothetical protein
MENSTLNQIKEQLENLNANDKKIIFGNIKYNTEDDFVNIMKSMSQDEKLIVVKTILEYNYYKGNYTLIESEFISCLLRYL